MNYFYKFFVQKVVYTWNCRLALKLDELGVEIAKIALPAALALTADPIASLVDTAFIGQIGNFTFFFFFFLLYQV